MFRQERFGEAKRSRTCPMSTPGSLRFPPVDGLIVRADFDGGAMSSDFGPLVLRGVDQQSGLIKRLAPGDR